jgi:hypothetical protein
VDFQMDRDFLSTRKSSFEGSKSRVQGIRVMIIVSPSSFPHPGVKKADITARSPRASKEACEPVRPRLLAMVII